MNNIRIYKIFCNTCDDLIEALEIFSSLYDSFFGWSCFGKERQIYLPNT